MSALIIVLEGSFLLGVLWGAVEDIKYRAVSLWVLSVIGILSVGLFVLRWEEQSLWSILAILLVSALVLWLLFKQKAGWADFVLIVSIFSGFQLGICCWALVMSCLLSVILLCIGKVRKEGIPFFSVLGFSMICIYVGEMIWTMFQING